MEIFMIDASTILVFLFTFMLVFYTTRRRKGIPPGPTLLPVIGNIHNLVSGNVFEKLEVLRRRYGDVFSLYVGTHLMIVLNGYTAIHDALVKKGKLFGCRPESRFETMGQNYRGIIMTNGQRWKEQRRFALEALQELCFKNSGQYIEDVVTDELTYFTDKLSEQTEAFDIDNDLSISVSNIITRILYNRRYGFDHRGIKTQIARLREGTLDYMKSNVICHCFPFLNKLPFDLINLKNKNDRLHKVISFYQKNFDEIKESSSAADRHTFASLYLERLDGEIKERNVESTCTTSSFNAVQMQHTSNDLFVAGSETTVNAMRWLLVRLILNPKVQDRAFSEIDKVLGTKQPCISDRKRLPYVDAVILEGLRIDPVVPLSVPHTVAEDTIFHGFEIPGNCSVTINLHSVLRDPSIWYEPDVFKPQRFLNETGTGIVSEHAFIPFSLGPRACLGETLARTELFLFMTTMLQRYMFMAEADGNLPTLDGALLSTWRAKPFKMRVKRRI